LRIILQTFNLYAFVQVGVYGKSYCQSAKGTFRLIKETGMTAVANDDMIDNVLEFGRGWGTFALIGVASLLSILKFQLPWYIVIVVVIIAACYGFALLSMVGVVIEISAATICVLFALDPQPLQYNHPKKFEKLNTAWQKRFKKLPKFLRPPGSQSNVLRTDTV